MGDMDNQNSTNSHSDSATAENSGVNTIKLIMFLIFLCAVGFTIWYYTVGHPAGCNAVLTRCVTVVTTGK